MFASDHAEPQREGRIRWLMSTCLAAGVGAVAIFAVIFGAADPNETGYGFLPALQRLRDGNQNQAMQGAPIQRDDGLKWAVPKVDRLRTTSGAVSTRFVIHETLRQKKGGREYIFAKPYVRIVSNFATVPANYADVIPPFNPFKLYANNDPLGQEDGARGRESRSEVTVRVVELLGGVLPGEDAQELDAEEAQEIVSAAIEKENAALKLAAGQPALAGTTANSEPDTPSLGDQPLGATGKALAEEEIIPPNTSVLHKEGGDDDGSDSSIDDIKPVIKIVREGQTLAQLLTEAGADTWQAREMIDAMKSALPEKQVTAGLEVHIALQPSLTQQNRLEPVRFSIFGEGHSHRVTVMRDDSGEFVASATPMEETSLLRLSRREQSSEGATSTLYASLYHAALLQSIPPDTIAQILRIHAYETDFRRRLRAGDSAEYFFDLKDDGGTDGPPGELLCTAVTSGGESAKFYRFRTHDGQVDYYDAEGNNAKKFLNRRPVRGDDVRLTSGFGYRFHPLLNQRKMHTGVDWAAAPGTPILASGNGTIEQAGRKGNNGNYVRIRHANGYQTAYSHMTRFAPGAAAGVKVRQGQVIGYVGTTGLSSGPHLHFEVLVNNQFVDPMSIQVPRERKLEGSELVEFQKERTRIDDLMRRPPVMTASK